MNATCQAKTTPYTHHTEREERYHRELLEIEKQYKHRKDAEAMKTQALQNACSSEFIDATMKLFGKRVRIAHRGQVFSTEYSVVRIVKIGETRSDERACFGIVHKNNGRGEEEVLPIFPSTKISILVDEPATDELASHFY